MGSITKQTTGLQARQIINYTCKLYRLLITKAHLPTLKDSKVRQLTNDHIRGTDVPRNPAQLFQNHFLSSERTVLLRKRWRLVRKMKNRKTQELSLPKSRRPMRKVTRHPRHHHRPRSLRTLRTSITSSQNSLSRRKEGLLLTIRIR